MILRVPNSLIWRHVKHFGQWLQQTGCSLHTLHCVLPEKLAPVRRKGIAIGMLRVTNEKGLSTSTKRMTPKKMAMNFQSKFCKIGDSSQVVRQRVCAQEKMIKRWWNHRIYMIGAIGKLLGPATKAEPCLDHRISLPPPAHTPVRSSAWQIFPQLSHRALCQCRSAAIHHVLFSHHCLRFRG